jgi:hypothetical protein
MRTRVALLLWLLPAAAFGQSAGTISISESSDLLNGGKNDQIINIAECKGTPTRDAISLSWTLSAITASDIFYKVWAMTEACPGAGDAVPTDAVELTNGFQAIGGSTTGIWPPTGNIDVVADIIAPLQLNACDTTTNINLCVTVYDSGQGATVQAERATAALKLDATPPAAPVISRVDSGDSALTVYWDPGTGGGTVGSWAATATPVAPDATHTDCSAGGTAGSCTVTVASQHSCRIEGLTNGACYDVAVAGTSGTLNPGPASQIFPGTPYMVEDFWRRYAAAGGREQGGCGGSAGLLALLVLAPLAPRLRRRRP